MSSLFLYLVIIVVLSYVSNAQLPQSNASPPPPVQSAAPIAPLPIAAAPPATPIQCEQSLTPLLGAGSIKLTLPFMANVNFYVWSDQVTLTSLSAFSPGVTRTLLGQSAVVPYPSATPSTNTFYGYLSLTNLAALDVIEVDVEGTGNARFWILCQCQERTTTAPPTPPPTPLPATPLTLGVMDCGTAIIGQYGESAVNVGTISLQIRQPSTGSVALYVNGLIAQKLKAFVMPNPMGPPLQHPANVPVAETSRSGIQYLYIPSVSPGSDVIFHIDFEGQGQYYAITQCLTPAPTMAPTTPMPTTRMPTPEITGLVPP